jgi:hypothetical protein
MSIYELDISWATTANERRHLHGELLASERVRAVFVTARDDVVAIFFSGDCRDFEAGAQPRHGVPEDLVERAVPARVPSSRSPAAAP